MGQPVETTTILNAQLCWMLLKMNTLWYLTDRHTNERMLPKTLSHLFAVDKKGCVRAINIFHRLYDLIINKKGQTLICILLVYLHRPIQNNEKDLKVIHYVQLYDRILVHLFQGLTQFRKKTVLTGIHCTLFLLDITLQSWY